MKLAGKLFFTLLTLAYPFLVYWGMQSGQKNYLFLLLTILFLGRLLLVREQQERKIIIISAGALLLCIVMSGIELSLLLYPVIVNLILLYLFASSLASDMPIVERLARIQEPDLPFHAIKYTRHVTQAWCLFFIVNGAISAITVVINDQNLWFWYNGVISYVLIASMFIGERLIRNRVREKHP